MDLSPFNRFMNATQAVGDQEAFPDTIPMNWRGTAKYGVLVLKAQDGVYTTRVPLERSAFALSVGAGYPQR